MGITNARLRKALASLLAAAITAVGLLVVAAQEAQAICKDEPPDYPGCTKEQVRALAEADTGTWLKEYLFGRTDSILAATNLTADQKDKVWTATRDNLKKILAHDAAHATAKENVASKADWTTQWRNNTYTLDTFPYKAWTDQFFSGCDTTTVNGICPVVTKACYDDVGNTTDGWAYLECTSGKVPTSWDNYWQAYYQWLDNPGAQGDTVCKREIFVGTTVGATVGGVGGAFAGPAAAGIGALTGVITGLAGGLVTCAANALADQWKWD